jgi:hypothetical protein
MTKHADPKSQAIIFNRSSRIHAIASLAVMSFAWLGCIAAPEEEGAVGAAEQASLTTNSLTTNSLTTNSLTTNALTSNSLTTNSLTTNSLTTNALTASALEDPLARQLLKYVVSCALPAGEQVDITVRDVDYTFPGELGLAPGWGDPSGSCGPSCRSWVSACVLSRVNYLGTPVPISLHGEHPALATTPQEQDTYPRREAAYWGDIFSATQVRQACLAPGQTEIPRVCGPSIHGCVIDVVGPCEEVCNGARDDGGFVGCDDQDDNGANAPVTVFLR